MFRDHAVKRAAVHIETQRMTPQRSNKIGAAYLEKQGLGCPWGRADFTEEGCARTVDAHLPTCACCGFRNMTTNFGKTPGNGEGLDGTKWFDGTKGLERSHRNIDLSLPQMQAVLKMDDDRETDSPDTNTNKRRRGRLRTEHLASMRQDKLRIPISDDGKVKDVELWRLHSAWPDVTPAKLHEERDKYPSFIYDSDTGRNDHDTSETLTGKPKYYNLHPEFVTVENGESGEKVALVTVCSECDQKIFSLDKKPLEEGLELDENNLEAATPKLSIAAGVDFGHYKRIGLERPTLRERLMFAKLRHCLHVIKIESNVDEHRTRERGQSAIKGCGIMFDHDSPQVVADLLSPKSINACVSLQFVGPDGERDRLVQKVLGSANVCGRWFVVCQWLRVLQRVNRFYTDDLQLEDLSIETVTNRVKAANEALVAEAMHTNDERVARQVEIGKDDVRNVRILPSCASEREQGETEPPGTDGAADADGDGVFPFRCSFVTSAAKSANGCDTDANHVYLVSAANALGINVREEQVSYSEATSRREREALNEFEHGDVLLCKAFPDVFMFGQAYKNARPALHKSESAHLLMQHTTNAASCQPLLFQLFDQIKRQAVILGMHAKCVSNKEAFEDFANEFCTEEFHEKMRDAVKNPNGNCAKFVLRKTVPFLTCAGRKSVFGAVERNRCAGEILALGRRFSCASNFLTLGIDDINHPNAIRFALASANNSDFPSMVSDASHVAMRRGLNLKDGAQGMIPFRWSDRHKLMIENPVGAALAYKQVIEDVMTILVGAKPRRAGNGTKLTPPDSPDSFGITGTPWAFFGKSETTGSGALHFHVVVWGGLSPDLLESVSDVPELCAKVAAVLDSTNCASLDRHHHVRDLVARGVKDIGNVRKLRARGDSHLSSAGTVLPVTLSPAPDALSDSTCPAANNDATVTAPPTSARGEQLEGCDGNHSKGSNSTANTTPCAAPNQQVQIKRSKPSAIGSIRRVKPTTMSVLPRTLPRAMQIPPDPLEETDDYIWHYSGTIIHCGMHCHTFTCKKPPKGWHGCRLSKPSGMSNGTRPVELRLKIDTKMGA